MTRRPHVLLVDDDADDRALASRLLEGFLQAVVVEAGDGAVFASHLSTGGFDLVVTDLELSWGDPGTVLDALSAVDPKLPVVVFTRDQDLNRIGAAVAGGIDALVPKTSAGFLDLVETVRDLLTRGEETGSSPAEPAIEDRFAGLSSELPIGLLRTTQDSRIVEANDGLARLLGVGSARKLVGRSLSDFLADPTDRVRWRTLVAGRESVRDWEVLVDAREGRRWARLTAWWVPGRAGGHCEAVLEEITEYKRVEAELDRQARALRRSNAELEEYARVVSHDLQEPLQLISRYANLLAELEQGESDWKGRPFVDHLVRSAERLQQMVDDILELSRVGSSDGELEPVSLDQVLETVLENLDAVIQDRGAEVTIGPLPEVTADRGQMVQLFQNLVSNALKFSDAEEPRVEIAAREVDGESIVSVTDNGIGIAPEDQERIFEMFRRLHPASRYPGSGIGLAICKRIVERHGGSIEVSSSPDRGATFRVRLPSVAGSENDDNDSPSGEKGNAWNRSR